MGASQSKNVADAVAEVTNSISQQTSADESQVSLLTQQINLANCQFTTGKDFNVDLFASSSQTSQQILDALQDTTVQNDISQRMAQEAMSKVGPLGIGFADASNNVSTFAQATNVVVDAMRATSQQMAIADQQFNCENSTFNIGGSINWNFRSEADFLSTQTLNNSQVSSLVNDISQETTQRATATVVGFGGLLLLIVVLLVMLGLFLLRPLGSTGGRFFMTVLIIGLVILVGSLMYVYQTPPFFQKPVECSPYSPIGGCPDRSLCVDVQPQKMTYVPQPPLRYVHSLIGGGPSGALLYMIIASATDEPNMGFTYRRNKTFQDPDPSKPDAWVFDTFWNRPELYPDIQPLQLPNPLTLPDTDKLCRIPNEYRTGKGTYNFGMCTPRPFSQISNDIVQSCSGSGPCFTASLDTDDPSTILSVANVEAWRQYLNDPSPERRRLHQKHARFVMSLFLGHPCVFYIDDDELVTVDDGVFRAVDVKNATYRFQDYGGNPNVFMNGTNQGGHLVGPIGVYKDNVYNLQHFMRKVGVYLLLAFVLLTIVVIWLRRRRSPRRR